MVIISKNNELEPKVYIADLAAYNAGFLHGVWVDATLDESEIWEEIRSMLARSPVGEDAEEHAIHDYSDFCEAELGEYVGISSIVEMAEFLVEYGRLGAKVYAYYNDLEEAVSALEDRYCGEYASVADFAQGLTEDTQEIPAHLSNYIDYEKMARDLELSGDVFTIEMSFQEVHIFWSQ